MHYMLIRWHNTLKYSKKMTFLIDSDADFLGNQILMSTTIDNS